VAGRTEWIKVLGRGSLVFMETSHGWARTSARGMRLALIGSSRL
jgi:hypothetical protein